VQLYVPDMAPMQKSLESLGLSYMKRLSGTDHGVAHMAMQIGGRVYEVKEVGNKWPRQPSILRPCPLPLFRLWAIVKRSQTRPIS
jgi:hypothetical protein